MLPLARVAALDERLELALAEAAGRVAQLEGPEEVRGLARASAACTNVTSYCLTYLLEVGANGEDLVYEVLNGEDVVLAEVLLDDLVVGERDALLVDLAVAALVDKLADGLEVRLANYGC